MHDLLRYVEAILRVYNALGRRDNIHKARIKILIREMKPEHFTQNGRGRIRHPRERIIVDLTADDVAPSAARSRAVF